MSGVMVVTGGSRGIGAATARLAAARGYDVAINYRTRQAAAEAVAADAARAQVRAITMQGDVGRDSDVVRLFETSTPSSAGPPRWSTTPARSVRSVASRTWTGPRSRRCSSST